MLYVERSENGKIIGLRTEPGPDLAEAKTLADKEIIDFLENNLDSDPLRQLLINSDSGFIRLLEDLIDLLMKKNLIIFTELPEKAQEKIIERKKIRERISSQNLMVEEIL